MISTLQLFTEPHFKGETVTLHDDMPDLSAIHFLKTAQSLTVFGDPWIVFSDSNYKGEFDYYPEGNHKSLLSWDNKICSVRVVKGDLDDPSIKLYDKPNYTGKKITLEGPVPSLQNIGFKPSSYKVTRGAWILYTNDNYQDKKGITLAKDEIPDISKTGSNIQVKSLKPI
ncbi:epidermal differentiation-specific protein-like [Lithobates pipiens]